MIFFAVFSLIYKLDKPPCFIPSTIYIKNFPKSQHPKKNPKKFFGYFGAAIMRLYSLHGSIGANPLSVGAIINRPHDYILPILGLYLRTNTVRPYICRLSFRNQLKRRLWRYIRACFHFPSCFFFPPLFRLSPFGFVSFFYES